MNENHTKIAKEQNSPIDVTGCSLNRSRAWVRPAPPAPLLAISIPPIPVPFFPRRSDTCCALALVSASTPGHLSPFAITMGNDKLYRVRSPGMFPARGSHDVVGCPSFKVPLPSGSVLLGNGDAPGLHQPAPTVSSLHPCVFLCLVHVRATSQSASSWRCTLTVAERSANLFAWFARQNGRSSRERARRVDERPCAVLLCGASRSLDPAGARFPTRPGKHHLRQTALPKRGFASN